MNFEFRFLFFKIPNLLYYKELPLNDEFCAGILGFLWDVSICNAAKDENVEDRDENEWEKVAETKVSQDKVNVTCSWIWPLFRADLSFNNPNFLSSYP